MTNRREVTSAAAHAASDIHKVYLMVPGKAYSVTIEEIVQSAVDEATAEKQKRIDVLATALRDSLNHYVDLANSGDCGFWNPEDEGTVIAARAALKAIEEEG